MGLKVLPRFFLVTILSGVTGMSFSLDGVTERYVPASAGSPSHAVVQCKKASWTYRYHNGYTVVLRGPLTVDVHVETLPSGQPPKYQIKCFNFDAGTHEQQIALEAIEGIRHQVDASNMTVKDSQFASGSLPLEDARVALENASIPMEPINAFGIPQVTMRCLEVASFYNCFLSLSNCLISLQKVVKS